MSLEITDYRAANYDDVLLEVQSALPGLAFDDWDVVLP